MLPNDVSRCWHSKCEQADTCARYRERTVSSMSTPHTDRMCWTDQVREFERDAARFRYLQSIPAIDAQAFFWTYSSRTERRKAIDKAIQAREMTGERG